jgi:hypothetical protein
MGARAGGGHQIPILSPSQHKNLQIEFKQCLSSMSRIFYEDMFLHGKWAVYTDGTLDSLYPKLKVLSRHLDWGARLDSFDPL